ncbi:response regulator transcription factor [Butyrivibrio sp. INlla21]|uniref:response regulator transcription factor n=1 Tax=Butyrivibrio sp. INlla21 TaxID=1520811 RepID=UPI0008E56E9C|nr:response regulator [Butyrivibrio sp. INlla21]SFU94640.1 Helix-turn-helix domain-containing protein [Butyrivibrio sp. INlla21]
MNRTYRVMIIDDEESARKLMRAGIKWDTLNMEVVGEAASGIEAINIIDDVKPDIAFVDISMPFMDGIEFTKTATDRYPNLIIIIMTAINQFEYARKCVSLPVFDYMLKPMVRAEISDVLERAKKRLDESKDSWEDSKAEIETENSDENNSTELIKKYVEDNFTDSMLNLTFLAQYFGFSASYLSRKFKQDTGKNFVEYLNDLRMKKAVKIAKSNIKMYQIAAEVGIPDPNYFSKCFKKYTGMSYSDYISTK